MRSLPVPRAWAIVVGVVALVVAAAAPAVSLKLITGRQIKDKSITGRDLKPGSIALSALTPAARKALAGQTGPRGSSGLAGPPGAPGTPGAAGPAGPSFGDTVQVPNVNALPCNKAAVVGSESLTVVRPSRIWAHAQGLVIDNATKPTDTYEFTMWVELRDASGATLANSVNAGDTDFDRANRRMPLSVDGLLLAGGMPGGDVAGTHAYVAPPGTYVLTLILQNAQGTTCPATAPQFGFNQDSSLGYILVGTSP